MLGTIINREKVDLFLRVTYHFMTEQVKLRVIKVVSLVNHVNIMYNMEMEVQLLGIL